MLEQCEFEVRRSFQAPSCDQLQSAMLSFYLWLPIEGCDGLLSVVDVWLLSLIGLVYGFSSDLALLLLSQPYITEDGSWICQQDL